MRRALDAYPTEKRVTLGLLERVPICGLVLEPCAGEGQMAEVLAGQGTCTVLQNDIDPAYARGGWGWYGEDATDPQACIWKMRPSWVVTNPPYNQAMPILRNAFDAARVGVAFLLRLSFLEPTRERAGWLEAHAGRLAHLLIFGSPRPSFTGNGRTDSATVAWMVWRRDWQEGTNVQFVTDRQEEQTE